MLELCGIWNMKEFMKDGVEEFCCFLKRSNECGNWSVFNYMKDGFCVLEFCGF